VSLPGPPEDRETRPPKDNKRRPLAGRGAEAEEGGDGAVDEEEEEEEEEAWRRISMRCLMCLRDDADAKRLVSYVYIHI
jgi:hypothetical protein